MGIVGQNDMTSWSPPNADELRISTGVGSESIAVVGEEDYVRFVGRWW